MIPLTIENINLLKKIVSKSEKEKKEYGMIICKDKNKIFIPTDKITTGKKYYIEYEKCPVKTELIGRIHTHVNPTQKRMDNYKKKTGIPWETEKSTFTEQDFLSMDITNSPLEILATMNDDKIKISSIDKDSFEKLKKEQLLKNYSEEPGYFKKLLSLQK